MLGILETTSYTQATLVIMNLARISRNVSPAGTMGFDRALHANTSGFSKGLAIARRLPYRHITKTGLSKTKDCGVERQAALDHIVSSYLSAQPSVSDRYG